MGNQQRDLQHNVNEMVENIERTWLRTIMKKGYLCSAKCFENQKWTSEKLQQCVQRCQEPSAQAQNVVQQELQVFQNRVQRCASECQDRAQDEATALGQKLNEDKITQIQSKMEDCVSKCEETHSTLLSTVQQRIEQKLQQFK